MAEEFRLHLELRTRDLVATLQIQYNDFGVGLLPLFDVPMLAGRAFVPADAGEGSTAVIINENLARAIGGRPENVLGRRIRLAAERAGDGSEPAGNPWMEVIGVVPDFTTTEGIDPDPDPLLYFPLALERAVADDDDVQIAMRLRGVAGQPLAGRLRELAAAVDPGLQITGTRTAADMRREAKHQRYLGMGIAIVTLSVLLLSAAGIYAMMSFTVARRRREIGIRAALGASARQVLTGLLAALGPARRGLAVEPTEALRGDWSSPPT
jgi:hypothetical protein